VRSVFESNSDEAKTITRLRKDLDLLEQELTRFKVAVCGALAWISILSFGVGCLLGAQL